VLVIRLLAVGGLFFLRTVCPALVSPEGFDILDSNGTSVRAVGIIAINHSLTLAGSVVRSTEGLNMIQRRKLILVSKVLQCLANGVEFGEKESFMMVANKFIRNYRESMRRMLIYLAVRIRISTKRE